MRIKMMMEENRDTMGWGMIGTILAMATAPSLPEKLITAALVAGCGWLGSYIIKKVFIYSELRVTGWWKNRKTKSDN